MIIQERHCESRPEHRDGMWQSLTMITRITIMEEIATSRENAGLPN